MKCIGVLKALYKDGDVMRIWQLQFEVDKYDNLVPVGEFTADEIQSFDGRRKKDIWNPLPVKRMEPEKELELSDAPGFIFPVFSKKALEILRPLIQNSVEELELQFQEAEYYGINVTAVLNVIDYSKSEYRMYSDGKRIMAFQKYAFRSCKELINTNIFKIVDEPTRRAFVSDIFKQTVEKNNLLGFKFKLVWEDGQQ